MWSARSDRIRNESFAGLLAANLAFIYLLSTFFSPAEDFPLGTALFFAFLITLLLWLYDVYKPVYEEANAAVAAAAALLAGEAPAANDTINNEVADIPYVKAEIQSIFIDDVASVIEDGHVTRDDVCEGIEDLCTANGI